MRRQSLRFYIVLLVLLSLVPSAAYIAVVLFRERQSAIADAIKLQVAAEQSIVAGQTRVIDSAITLITALARVSETHSDNPAACSAFLAKIAADSPRYANFGVADLSGQVVCSAVPLTTPVNLANKPWFRRAIQTDKAVVGDFEFGMITGEPVLAFGLALENPDGRPAAVLFASLDLKIFTDLFKDVEWPAGSSFTMLDHAGAVLAHLPDPENWVGQPADGSPLFKSIATQGTDTPFQALGLDNRLRLFNAFSLTSGDDKGSAYAAIGIPIETITAGPDRHLARDLTGSAAVVILLFFGCYLFADRLISRPIDKLVEFSQQITKGDLSARSGSADARGEIGELALSMDKMAAALEQNETTLRESEERFRRLVESTDVIPYTWDFDARRFTYVGPSAARILGYPLEQWLLDGFGASIIHPDDSADYLECWKKVAAGNHGHACECRVFTADGQTVWMRNVFARGTRLGERSTGYGFIFDVTEAKIREQQLNQAQKMESIGQLTGGFAHDFNNLLTVILGNLQLLEQSLDEDAPARKRVRTASDAALRGANLTRQLLAFSRRQVLAPKIIELNALLGGMTDMLHRTLGESIEIRLTIDANLWSARVDPSQLESALLNLAINARDAMPEGGRLTIEASNRRLNEEYAAYHVEVSPGPYVLLAVTDTGIGMSSAVLQHAFDPFFTTKDVGKGTGLGLSMVFGFIKQSGGHVKAYSEEGHGTTIKLYLPRADAPGQSSAEPAELDLGPPTGKETILVVEDDQPARETAAALLEELGYRVIQAANAASALSALEQNSKVDLLFTDVVMPGGLNGVVLARKVAERWPDIKVLYTSGHTVNLTKAWIGSASPISGTA
jgi:PAS domain S-box-containing protein